MTAEHGGPVNRFRGGPVSVISILAFLSTQYSHWPCVGWPKRILLNTISFNPLAYTVVRETAGLARSINTQPAVRRNSDQPNITAQHGYVLKSIKINFA